jgi:tRNA(adenine34) deaminase
LEAELDAQWMELALAQAQAAAAAGEVPVGAVVVRHGQVVGSGFNAPIARHDPSAHAEIMALRAAAEHLGNYRLDDCTMYVTLEPCLMCAGAMLHARLKRVVFGAPDPKTGATGSVLNVFALPLNHHTQVQGGFMAAACAQPLLSFFGKQRALQQLNKAQAGGALREDALRTSDSCFSALPDRPTPSRYVHDLPSLAGLRLHYIDAGLTDAPQTLVCLHGPADWCYAWRSWAALAQSRNHRVICPDLIGFGQSDKPKKEVIHTLAWHVQILLELIDRLNLNQVTLVVHDHAFELGKNVLRGAALRVGKLQSAQPDSMDALALAAPFPDRGHCAALRAFAALTMKSRPQQDNTPST